MSIKVEQYGKTSDGKDINIFTLSNNNDVTIRILNMGGAIATLMVPDRDGNLGDVVLGYENLNDYEENDPHFGALIGRYGNRIGKAQFTLNGKLYQLAKNDGNNQLHGGNKGFDKVVWNAEVVKQDGEDVLKLTYRSVDGEENYPGNLDATVIYSLNDENEFKLSYHAVCDQDTIVNLTNHVYFNLAGHDSGTIVNHEIMLNADAFTPIDDEFIPTGEIRKVEGTPFDLRKSTAINNGIGADYEQIKFGNGYDHNFCLNKTGNELSKAGELYEPNSGRLMEVYTTNQGIQFYTGNFLSGKDIGKGNYPYGQRTGLCLETQNYPNAINIESFPNAILRAGEEYKNETIYKFATR